MNEQQVMFMIVANAWTYGIIRGHVQLEKFLLVVWRMHRLNVDQLLSGVLWILQIYETYIAIKNVLLVCPQIDLHRDIMTQDGIGCVLILLEETELVVG